MKGLRKYIAPFAPDQSGAAAVFCELGAMVIILDAGGCAGNICGFDEPRWFDSRSAIFSAGLRDMDAILGRDDRLVEKVVKACYRLSCHFIVVIGTPVPSVIATDYRALTRMLEKKTGLPVITIDTNGMELYDEGVRKAYTAVFKKFSRKEAEGVRTGIPVENDQAADYPAGTVGILGATPLDVTLASGSFAGKRTDRDGTENDYGDWLKDYYRGRGYRTVLPYGMGAGLLEIKAAGRVDENIVISPSALEAARYLQKVFGTPYRTDYPLETLPGWENILKEIPHMRDKKILIVHQQVLADTLRKRILEELSDDVGRDRDITVASWFNLDRELAAPGDIRIREEDQWIELVRDNFYDYIIGDRLFSAAITGFEGEWIDLDHFAVSGKR